MRFACVLDRKDALVAAVTLLKFKVAERRGEERSPKDTAD